MPALKPHARFLLRGSALLITLLTIWWFVLQIPMGFLLKKSAQALGALAFDVPSSRFLTEAPNGDWTFEVPIDFTAAAIHYHSIDFDLARSDAGAFTFGLPVFWAIVLAAPWTARSRGTLAKGTAVMATMEMLLLLIFVQEFAHKTAAQMSQNQDAVSAWFWRFSDYLMMCVIPYEMPFVTALWLHPELKRLVFGWEPPERPIPCGNPIRKRKRVRMGRSLSPAARLH